MGWWTDLKHGAEKVAPALAAAVNSYAPGAGAYVAKLGDAIGSIGDSVRDSNDSGRAPSYDAPPEAPAKRAPSLAGVADINGTQVWQVTARAQLGKWTPADLPVLTDNALYEAKEGGKVPAYPGLLWNATKRTYTVDPKGTPTVPTVIRNGREVSVDDAKFLDARDKSWEAASTATETDGGDMAKAKKRRMWMYVGGGVAAALVLAFVLWLLTRTKKA